MSEEADSTELSKYGQPEKKLSPFDEFRDIARGQGLPAEKAMALFNNTPKRFVSVRPGKGGGQWAYVSVEYVRTSLNYLFDFAWSFEVKTTMAEMLEVAKATGAVVLVGELTVKVDGETVTKQDVGRSEVKTKKAGGFLDFGNDVKAAQSDSLRRCARQFSLFSDVYGASEEYAAMLARTDDDGAETPKLNAGVRDNSDEVPCDE